MKSRRSRASTAKAVTKDSASPTASLQSSNKDNAIAKWRREHLPPLSFPRPGFDHVYSKSHVEEMDRAKQADTSSYAGALNAQFAAMRTSSLSSSASTINNPDDAHDYGSTTKTPDDAPVGALMDKWRLLPHFLKTRSLMRQHVDSFDHFINVEIQQIVKSPSACEIRSDHDPKFFLRYEKCWIGRPSVDEESYLQVPTTPFECRLRDCTYSAPIYCQVRYTRADQIIVNRRVQIGRMPIMLRSSKCWLRDKTHHELEEAKECPYDPGGYFIIKGVEKVILIQEQLSKNRVILEEDDKKGGVAASITSSTHERKSKAYIAMKNGRVALRNNTLGDDIPIMIVLKAMGVESDLEAVQLVGSEAEVVDALALSLEEAVKYGIYNQQQALHYIGAKIRTRTASYVSTAPAAGPTSTSTTVGSASYRRQVSLEDEAREVLAHVVLSHVPVHNFNFRTKAIYIGHIVRRVLLVHLKKMPLDDKDYYGNKRLELAGNLLSLLFEDLFKIFNKDLKRQADLVLSKPNRTEAFDIIKVIRTDTISNGFNNAIATGNWVLKRFRMDRAGVTQILSRLSYMSALGMMTRINSQFEKTRKVSGPRSLQPSQWGQLCPCDTPEGEACGLVKNLALLAHITKDEPDLKPFERICRDLGVEDCCRLTGNEIHGDSAFLVFMNGIIFGLHRYPVQFVDNMRQLRRKGVIAEFVSVFLNEGQRAVYIATDGGRVCRPLIVVDYVTGRPKLTQVQIESVVLGVLGMNDLIRQGVIEYLDCNEESNALIAVTERDLDVAIRQGLERRKMRYTHLEVDPFTILGVVGGIIPFPHHNQSPRNTYTVAMAKQAMGTVAMNQYERMDGLLYSLVYPQKPLVTSRTLDLVDFNNIPGGQNACIAIMSYSGYDIEDAIILNKASIDRGLGRCMVLRKHQTNVRRYANQTRDQTCGPPKPDATTDERDKRLTRYQGLDMDGVAMVGERVENGSVMVNKHCPTDTTSNFMTGELARAGRTPDTVPLKPSPLTYRGNAASYVDKVILTCNENENFLVKIMLRQVRRPEIGDKFASRHGQKGVCGLIVPEADLPFDEQGIVPDLIMNPHGFPSRMTVGKLLEMLVGKAAVFEGRQAYGTAFGEEHGSADVPSMASEALMRHGLNYSGKDILYSGVTGEPLEAYIFTGPVFYQKLKHMVLDKAHARARGPRAVLTRQPTEGRSRDGGLRLGEMERDCLIAYGASNLIMERLMHSSDAFSASVCMTCGLLQYQHWCQFCRSGEKVVEIRLPYACKLLFQELQSMNVLPRLRLTDQT